MWLTEKESTEKKDQDVSDRAESIPPGGLAHFNLVSVHSLQGQNSGMGELSQKRHTCDLLVSGSSDYLLIPKRSRDMAPPWPHRTGDMFPGCVETEGRS